ncbi:MAG TPA: hypothetical protein VMF56_02585 [Acidobacteriaceae bacterium]|nr:hypothetical protein [Acidobacteriaceae bacterium]
MIGRRLILGIVIAMVSGCSYAQTLCSARTPEQTLPSGSVAATAQPAPSSDDFYRLARIVVDPELHRRWALIANCTHPERPLEIVALVSGHVVVPNVVARPVSSASSIPGVSHHTIQNEVVHLRVISSLPNVPAPTSTMPAKTSTSDPSTAVPVIRAGDLVRLWSLDANVRLEMQVVSLEYGRVGQIIHVRRMGQTALLAGVVVGKDSAELIP